MNIPSRLGGARVGRSVIFTLISMSILASVAYCQIDGDPTLKDLGGLVSTLRLQESQRKAALSRRRYEERTARIRRQVNQLRLRNQKIIVKINNNQMKRRAVGAGSTTALVASQQNLTLSFVTPYGRPVTGVRLRAVVHDGGHGEHRLNDLQSDAAGRIRLTQMGPFPITIDFEVAGNNAEIAFQNADAAVAAQTEPEWRFADAHSACVFLERPLGRHVAANRVDGVEPSLATVRVASTGPFFGVLRRRAAPTHHVAIYDYVKPQPIVMERTLVDLEIAAPPGATVTMPDVPAFTTTQGAITNAVSTTLLSTVDATGRAVCNLPVSMLGGGPISLRVSKIFSGGEAESVIDQYGVDPYSRNTVEAPPLRLARVADCRIAGDLGVLSTREELIRALGDADTKGNRGRAITKLQDGSELWTYSKAGIQLKLRKLPKGLQIAERIRLTSADGGSVGGVSVGFETGRLPEALGTPDSSAPESSSGQVWRGETGKRRVDGYLDGGLLVCHDDTQVRWIEIARPTYLLKAGTTAFAHRDVTRLYIAPFQGNGRTPLGSSAALEQCFQSLCGVKVVHSQNEATLLLKTRAAEFHDEKGDVLIGALPFRYSCDMSLQYTIRDVGRDTTPVQDKQISASAGVNYTKEILAGALLTGVLAHQKGDVWKILAGAVVVGGVGELQRSVRQAVNRCPSIAANTLVDQLARDVAQASDYSVRVTGIDYDQGRLTINAGTADGVVVSSQSNPEQFEILIHNDPLPGDEIGGNADYYIAKVIDASEHTSTCELRHVRRRLDGYRERISDDKDTRMVRAIPDPATGIVSARAVARFPSMTVVPQSALVPDDQAEEAFSKAIRERQSNE